MPRPLFLRQSKSATPTTIFNTMVDSKAYKFDRAAAGPFHAYNTETCPSPWDLRGCHVILLLPTTPLEAASWIELIQVLLVFLLSRAVLRCMNKYSIMIEFV